MASACVNSVGVAPSESVFDRRSRTGSADRKFVVPDTAARGGSSAGFAAQESFLDRRSCVWRNTRISTGVDFMDLNKDVENGGMESEAAENESADAARSEFEFRLEKSVDILPADELFSDGKLLPLQQQQQSLLLRQQTPPISAVPKLRSDESSCRRRHETHDSDPFLFSPKAAPSCSSRWIELLRLKKLPKEDSKTTSSCRKPLLLHSHHRSTKSATATESDNEAATISPRISLSLDSDKATTTNLSKVRVSRNRAPQPESASQILGTSLDSPRINPSGKIVFHGLERSSSSPSSLNGGPRYKHRGMERSYSANVRVAPVLNLRVTSKSSVFGFPLFSSKQKKDSHSQSHSGKLH